MAGQPPRGRPPTTPAARVPTGHARQGDSAGPPHPHTRAHSTWVTDPDSPPGGRTVREGGAPDRRRPSQRRRAPPPGTPFRHPLSAQRRPGRAHAVGTVLGPHACTTRTRGRAAGRGTAPGTRRPSQRWQATAPGDGPPPLPRHTAPTGHASQGDSAGPHTCPPAPTARGWRTLTARAKGRRSRKGERLISDAPHNGERHPHSAQRRPARAHAVEPVLAPHARTNRTQDTRVAETPGSSPQRTAPDTRRPSQRSQATPPWDGPPPPPRQAAPTEHANQGDSPGSPQPHTRANSIWVTEPTARLEGGQSGEGKGLTADAPHNDERHPPPGTPIRHPHSAQRRPARAHAVGPVLGPHVRTNHIRDTRVAEPRLPAPEDGRSGEGQRLTPEAPHNCGWPPPPGTAPHHPRGTHPPQGMQATGTVLGPHTRTPAPTAHGWRTLTARLGGGQSCERKRLTSDSPHNGARHPPPPGDAPPPTPQRATPTR